MNIWKDANQIKEWDLLCAAQCICVFAHLCICVFVHLCICLFVHLCMGKAESHLLNQPIRQSSPVFSSEELESFSYADKHYFAQMCCISWLKLQWISLTFKPQYLSLNWTCWSWTQLFRTSEQGKQFFL